MCVPLAVARTAEGGLIPSCSLLPVAGEGLRLEQEGAGAAGLYSADSKDPTCHHWPTLEQGFISRIPPPTYPLPPGPALISPDPAGHPSKEGFPERS